MPKQKKKTTLGDFVLFDVLYENGARRSNRKVPRSEVDGLDGDAPAKSYIESQDRKIAEMSGQSPGTISSISRSRMR